MNDLKNTKIWIGDNPELSRKVQERLFQLGFKWGPRRETIAQYTESRSLYLWSNGTFCYHHLNAREKYFDGHPYREIHLWDLNLSSEGEYDENIGKEVIVQDAICDQISGKVGIIRDKNEYGYLIYQPGVEKTGSVHSPCVCYLESSVEGWFSQPEKVNTVDTGGSGYATTPTTNGSQTITRSALKEIWEVAQEGCSWKTELRSIARRESEFSDTVTLTLDEVERMYRDASVAQRRTLDQYLTRPMDGKNAFVKEFRVENIDALCTLSQELFGDSSAIEILQRATPADKPELRGRAFYVRSSYKVEVGDGVDGAGTYIAIFKK